MFMKTKPSQDSNKVHSDVLAEAREACYKARDAFYKCIETNSNKKSTEIASAGLLYPVECKKPRAEFVKSCRPSWVRHFDRRYCQEQRVKRLLDDDGPKKSPGSLPQAATVKV